MARKYGLIAHIALSVGWFGAVTPYLALSILCLTSHEPQVIKSAYLCMKMVGWYAIVPLSLAAIGGGLVQALCTPWGLVRHWWIVSKTGITILAALVLLRHMREVGEVARLTAMPGLGNPTLHSMQVQLLVHPAAGMLVLLVVIGLSILKPWGRTPFGQKSEVEDERRERHRKAAPVAKGPAIEAKTLRWRKIIGYHAFGILLFAFVILHLTDHSHGSP